MPTVSAAQHRLMEAAAHTKGGYGGVPQSVGKEFVGQDAPRSIAAGILFVAPDGDVLLLRRAIGEPNYGGHWALPGGKADGEETAEQAADREVMEEIGESPRGENVLCDVVNTPNGFEFHTFLRAVPEKFVPELNEEHAGFVWTPPDDLPEPVHPGVARVIKALLRASKKVKIAADSADWNENEHPRAPEGKFGNGSGGSSKGTESGGGEMPDIPDFLKINKSTAGKKTSSSQKLLMPQFGLYEAIRKTVGDDKALADILIARKNDLASRFGEAKKEPKPMAKDGWSLVGLGRPFGRPIPGPGAARGAISPAMAYDRAFMAGARVERAGLAFDRATASVRHTDRDGRLHVSLTHISKATVNPYLGNEIPRFEELGLVPDKVYLLLRDPDELRKGAATFNNIPLLSDHVAVTAADHKPEHVIGSTGTDAVFDAPYLDNSLVIWAKRGIEYVESKKKKELSCAYHFRADMTPGVFEGKRYDGVMRDLVGNHVALVEEGRAGSDVVVGDSVNPKIKELLMSKQVRLSHMGSVARGALLAFLAPRLAMDAKINLVGALKGVTAKNFKETRPALEAALVKAVTPKLAQDASIDGLKEMLDMLEGTEVAEDAEAPKAAMNGEEDDDESETEPAADNDMEDDDDGMAGDEDEDEAAMAAAEAAKKKKAAKDKKAKDKAAKDAEVATASEKEAEKKAMDARIKLAADEAIKTERQTQQAIAEAREKVRPWVGNLPMAFDSVGGLYRKALTMMGKDVSKVKDDSALPYILEALPRPDSSVGSRPTVAMDSAASKSFAERFPGAASIRNV